MMVIIFAAALSYFHAVQNAAQGNSYECRPAYKHLFRSLSGALCMRALNCKRLSHGCRAGFILNSGVPPIRLLLPDYGIPRGDWRDHGAIFRRPILAVPAMDFCRDLWYNNSVSAAAGIHKGHGRGSAAAPDLEGALHDQDYHRQHLRPAGAAAEAI